MTVEKSCFQESGAVGSEIFTVFTSIPIISHSVVTAVEALINPKTGRKYGESATGTTETPDIPQTGVHESAAAATCAACFACRVPEMRALWLLVAMTCTLNPKLETTTTHPGLAKCPLTLSHYTPSVLPADGCVKDETAFAGRIEAKCLDGGSWYETACGPRNGLSQFMTTSQWALTYTEHRNFDTARVQHFASLFKQYAEDNGGASNAFDAQRIADAWFKRDVTLGEDQAASFYRSVCREMRTQFDVDAGPGHNNHSETSLAFITGHFLYES